MTTFTQRGQLGLFLPSDYKPLKRQHLGAPCPPDIRARLAALRQEFADRYKRKTGKSI